MELEHRIKRLLRLIEESKTEDSGNIASLVTRAIESVKSNEAFNEKGMVLKFIALEVLLLGYKRQLDSLTAKNKQLDSDKSGLAQDRGRLIQNVQELSGAIDKLRAILKTFKSPPHSFESFVDMGEDEYGD